MAVVAQSAEVATGTVYRHFPSKADLLTEVFRVASQHEVDAVASASAKGEDAETRLTAAVETFARRALQGRRLAWALLAEPVDPSVEAERLQFRRAYAAIFADIIAAGVQDHQLPEQDPEFTATALVGAIGEALVGPLSPTHVPTAKDEDALVGRLVTFALRSTTATTSS